MKTPLLQLQKTMPKSKVEDEACWDIDIVTNAVIFLGA